MTGLPIWYELMTPDPVGIAAFYRAVGGWEIPAAGNVMPNGSEYRMIGRSDGGNLGGVLTITPQMAERGTPSQWLTYFHVDDVAASVAKARTLGAQVWMPPSALPAGTMALLSDPQGAPFYLMDPTPPAGDPDAKSDVFDEQKAGHCRWNELSTSDAAAARDFYADLLGWQVDDKMPMGAAGDYLFVDAEGRRIGAINPMIGEGQRPTWLLYLGVDNIDRAHDAVAANGGTVIHETHEVPGGDFIFVATDPADARVAFVGSKGE